MFQEESMCDIDKRILNGVIYEQLTPQEREDRRKILGPVVLKPWNKYRAVEEINDNWRHKLTKRSSMNLSL